MASPCSVVPLVAVLADSVEQQPRAKTLAAHLCLPLARADAPSATLLLTVTAERLELHDADPGQGGAIYVDFVKGKNAFRRRHGGGVRQTLARAVGLRGTHALSILDVTPGLGQDAFVLASLGAEVCMVERSPVVAALLADGLHRLAEHAQTSGMDAPRMTLLQTDARQVLRACHTNNGMSLGTTGYPDVIYLDPMYPHRDGSALSKKEMRRLRILVGDDEDAPMLLEVALLCARKRVVVKRPRQASPLAGIPPTLEIKSKNTRFDVYLPSPDTPFQHKGTPDHTKGTAPTANNA